MRVANRVSLLAFQLQDFIAFANSLQIANSPKLIAMTTPLHSIDFCPICGGGLCGIRIVGDLPSCENKRSFEALIVCDECEAIWSEPDVSTVHRYPDLENAVSPVGGQPLWGEGSRWATAQDIEAIGWTEAVNPELDASEDADTTKEV